MRQAPGTFTQARFGLDDAPLDRPRLLVFVEIGETDGGIVHDLGEVDPNQCAQIRELKHSYQVLTIAKTAPPAVTHLLRSLWLCYALVTFPL